MNAHELRCDASLWSANQSAYQRGFTMIELIMVIIILGVLAVYAAPRILNTGDFTARGFHDETLSILRYAQKTAIAQRRMVCVTFDMAGTPNTSTLTFLNPAGGAAAANGCNANLTGPRGETPARIIAPNAVTYAAAPSFNFDGLGQPVSSAGVALVANQVIQVNNASNTITVEAATGYVHE
jgi:MSHA pilin protein MshC